MLPPPPDLAAIRKKYFPVKLANGYEIRTSDREEFYTFVMNHVEAVFGNEEKKYFRANEERRASWRPLYSLRDAAHEERFLFIDPTGKIVGWNMSESEDWHTFYLRNTGLLPDHQECGVYSGFHEVLVRYCSEIGYERLTSHHKGTNRRILMLKLRADYFLAGMELTERWGAMFKLVKFLKPDRRESFVGLFGNPDHV